MAWIRDSLLALASLVTFMIAASHFLLVQDSNWTKGPSRTARTVIFWCVFVCYCCILFVVVVWNRNVRRLLRFEIPEPMIIYYGFVFNILLSFAFPEQTLLVIVVCSLLAYSLFSLIEIVQPTISLGTLGLVLSVLSYKVCVTDTLWIWRVLFGLQCILLPLWFWIVRRNVADEAGRPAQMPTNEGIVLALHGAGSAETGAQTPEIGRQELQAIIFDGRRDAVINVRIGVLRDVVEEMSDAIIGSIERNVAADEVERDAAAEEVRDVAVQDVSDEVKRDVAAEEVRDVAAQDVSDEVERDVAAEEVRDEVGAVVSQGMSDEVERAVAAEEVRDVVAQGVSDEVERDVAAEEVSDVAAQRVTDEVERDVVAEDVRDVAGQDVRDNANVAEVIFRDVCNIAAELLRDVVAQEDMRDAISVAMAVSTDVYGLVSAEVARDATIVEAVTRYVMTDLSIQIPDDEGIVPPLQEDLIIESKPLVDQGIDSTGGSDDKGTEGMVPSPQEDQTIEDKHLVDQGMDNAGGSDCKGTKGIVLPPKEHQNVESEPSVDHQEKDNEGGSGESGQRGEENPDGLK